MKSIVMNNFFETWHITKSHFRLTKQPLLSVFLCFFTTLGDSVAGSSRWEAAELNRAVQMSAGALGKFEAILDNSTLEGLCEMRLPTSETSALPAIPQVISVIMWVRLDPGDPSAVLFGLGRRDGAFLAVATDIQGWPVVALLGHDTGGQICRAKTSASNLSDGKLHSLAVIINMSSGLLRLYVDGKPEAASVTNLSWRLGRIDQAFAQSLANTFPMAVFGNSAFATRVMARELTDQEIATMKPDDNESGLAEGNHLLSRVPDLDTAFAAGLLEATLLEFLPPIPDPGAFGRVRRRLSFQPTAQ